MLTSLYLRLLIVAWSRMMYAGTAGRVQHKHMVN